MGEGRLASWLRSRGNLVGPYRIEGPLGRGQAGTVHRARPLAGGPPAALRVLRGDWAERPAYAFRWARSLLGASLVRHPNVARLHDLGEAGSSVYAAWDLVAGPTLGETLATAERDAALVALLQAARGLAALHEAGLAHGGFGPEAARGTIEEGLRLVDGGWPRDPDAPDDLGPVPLKRREAADERAVREAAEAQDAAGRRADLVALGRLMQGAMSVQDHRALRELAARLVADDPAAAPPTARDVVVALEAALGLAAGGAFRPHPSEVETLREAAAQFRDAPAARTWRLAVAIGAGVLVGLIGLAVLVQAWLVAVGLMLFGGLTVAACLVAGSIGERDPLIERARALVVGARGADLLAGLGVGLLALVVLGVIGALRPLIVLGLAAAALATLYRLEPWRRRRDETREPVETARALAAGLRRQGIDESALRAFVRREGAAGLFEAVFDEPAAAIPAGEGHPEHPVDRALAAMRNGLMARLDRRLRRRRDERLRALFVALEGRRQTAGGVNLLTARRRSWRVADALIAAATELRNAPADGPAPAIASALRAAALAPDAVLIEHEAAAAAERPAIWGPLAATLLGPRARFLVGASLVAGCVLWMHQNGMLPGARLKELAQQAAQVRDLDAARRIGEAAGSLEIRLRDATDILRVPGLPGAIARWASSLGAGVAGLVLVLSALRGGWRTLGLAWAGAMVALLGAQGASLGGASAVALAVGAGLGLLALLWPERRRP
jgi:hypothetical protein